MKGKDASMHEINPACSYRVKARITEFPLPRIEGGCTDAAVVPVVKGFPFLKYGKHAYYFYNFAAGKCMCVEISHRHIIAPGLPAVASALGRKDSLSTRIGLLSGKYHYGFSFLEQIMLMTVPHTITAMGGGQFLVNLWSYVGYLEIDCNRKKVSYVRRKGQDVDHVLGSQQWLERSVGDIYYMTYSLPESLKKISDPNHPVPCRILKAHPASGEVSEVWSGPLTDYLHDILVDKSGRYCVVCELGMFRDGGNNAIPSKVLIIDMKQKRHWIISRFIVAAHAQFDPEEADVIYFSQHNFKFIPSSIITLLRKAIYSLEFLGPAAVYKYRLTPDGPEEVGVFTEPDMFRLTNFHVFMHRGEKVLAAMGFPNFIYLADARTMRFMRKITIANPGSYKYFGRDVPCFIGTFSPSSDGERLYVQTTRSFQVIDLDSGEPLYSLPLFFNHTAANHMQTTTDTSW